MIIKKGQLIKDLSIGQIFYLSQHSAAIRYAKVNNNRQTTIFQLEKSDDNFDINTVNLASRACQLSWLYDDTVVFYEHDETKPLTASELQKDEEFFHQGQNFLVINRIESGILFIKKTEHYDLNPSDVRRCYFLPNICPITSQPEKHLLFGDLKPKQRFTVINNSLPNEQFIKTLDTSFNVMSLTTGKLIFLTNDTKVTLIEQIENKVS